MSDEFGIRRDAKDDGWSHKVPPKRLADPGKLFILDVRDHDPDVPESERWVLQRRFGPYGRRGAGMRTEYVGSYPTKEAAERAMAELK